MFWSPAVQQDVGGLPWSRRRADGTMMREFGSENRMSLAPAASSSEPAGSPCPVHSFDTGGR